MKFNARNSNLLLLGLALTFVGASSAFAQNDDQIHGVTTVGAMAVERTTADIMQNPEPISPDSFFKHLIKSNEIEGDRSGLITDPNSPKTSQWPPVSAGNGGAGKGYGNGRFNPQTPGVQWDGDVFGNLTPSDAFGAVGPTQVLVHTNHNITVYSKTGVVGALNTTQDNFFASIRAGSGTSDPRTLFDRTSNRWIVIAINVSTPNRTLIAVSDGPTITGTTVWKYFFTTAPGSIFDDYESAGVDANGLYIGYNTFTGASGPQCIVVQKSSILGAGPIVSTRFVLAANSSAEGPYCPRGVTNDDPAPANGYFVGPSQVAFGRLVVRKVTGANTLAPTIGPNLLITVPATANPFTSVPSNGINLDQIDDRVFDANMSLNRKTGARTLWLAHHIKGTSAGVGSGAGTQNIARWYQVDPNPAAPTLVQSGTSFDASGVADHYSFPTIAQTGQGHAAMGFTMSKSGSFIRTGASGRLAGDALGTTQATTTAYTATQAYNVFATRWGDYSMTKVDPADDQTVWTIHHQSAGTSWKVRVVQLKAPAPSPITSVVPNVLTPGNNYNIVVTGTPAAGSEYYDTDASYPNRLVAAFSAAGVTVNSIAPFNHGTPQTFTMNVTVAPAAANGTRNLTVTNPDGQSVTLNNAITVQGVQNVTVIPSAITINLGNLSSGGVANLAAIDGSSLVICKGFVPSLTSPYARVQVNGTTALTNLTAYAFSATARQSNAGVFTFTVECFNYTTSTYDVVNTAAINTAFSTLTATVGANFNNYRSSGNVQGRMNVRQTGFSAVTIPCTQFDAASWSLTGN